MEDKSHGSGPLLLSWRFAPGALATTAYGGTRFTQAQDEARTDFLKRIARAIPGRAVVWMDELDEQL